MNWTTLDRILAWLAWVPAAPAPTPRPRRLRMTCPVCSKDLAVIRSTGRVWRHRCEPVPEYRDAVIDPRD